MIYEYQIDAGERYEDWMCDSIFSTELLSKKEFEEVVKEATETLENLNKRVHWSSVANWIVRNDKRFFYPEKGHIAIVKNKKLGGIY